MVKAKTKLKTKAITNYKPKLKLKCKIRTAQILLQCASLEHKDCAVLRDAVFYSFNGVLSAYITTLTPKMKNADYCVSAHAIVKDGEINKFRKQLKELKYNTGKGKRKSKVTNVKLLVSDR